MRVCNTIASMWEEKRKFVCIFVRKKQTSCDTLRSSSYERTRRSVSNLHRPIGLGLGAGRSGNTGRRRLASLPRPGDEEEGSGGTERRRLAILPDQPLRDDIIVFDLPGTPGGWRRGPGTRRRGSGTQPRARAAKVHVQAAPPSAASAAAGTMAEAI